MLCLGKFLHKLVRTSLIDANIDLLVLTSYLTLGFSSFSPSSICLSHCITTAKVSKVDGELVSKNLTQGFVVKSHIISYTIKHHSCNKPAANTHLKMRKGLLLYFMIKISTSVKNYPPCFEVRILYTFLHGNFIYSRPLR